MQGCSAPQNSTNATRPGVNAPQTPKNPRNFRNILADKFCQCHNFFLVSWASPRPPHSFPPHTSGAVARPSLRSVRPPSPGRAGAVGRTPPAGSGVVRAVQSGQVIYLSAVCYLFGGFCCVSVFFLCICPARTARRSVTPVFFLSLCCLSCRQLLGVCYISVLHLFFPL